ncbi:MAG TPA: sigma-70 family RNA polymerase sigma factor [Woeseiaceae bacterium]|jgi:RNA polymerase sigma-70 factor (ECF subfamily)|nr:sigma-70 family RNA polymerase sigma factor [Woeseiaceae bacterium]
MLQLATELSIPALDDGSRSMERESADRARRRRFDRIIGRYYMDMYRYAAWLSRDAEIADVVLQESLLRVWKSLDTLREESAAKHWLLTIVRRENARYFAGTRLETVDIDELTPAQTATVSTTDDHDLADLGKAISRLHKHYREPLVLQVLMGYSTEEIAKALGIKRAAVLTRLHRARSRLRQQLREELVSRRSAPRADDRLRVHAQSGL